jgi:hypothetical protein
MAVDNSKKIFRKNTLIAGKSIRELVIIFSIYLSLIPFALRPILVGNIGEESSGIFALLIIPIFSGIINNMSFRKVFFGRFGAIALLTFILYSYIGIVFSKKTITDCVSEISVYASFFAGFGYFSLIYITKKPKLHLLIFISLFTITLFILQVQTAAMGTQSGIGRTIDEGYFTFKYFQLLIIPTSIAISVFFRSGFPYSTLFIGLILLQFYSWVILGATRSSALALAISVLISSLSLVYKTNMGLISTKINQKYIYVLSITTSIFFLVVLTMTGVFFSDNSLISQRSLTEDREGNVSSRIQESLSSLSNLDIHEIIFGQGIGYERLHLGIFCFLLKGGIILFLLVVVLLYIVSPLILVKALFKPSLLDPYYRTSVLVVLPGILTWAFILLTSGGFSLYNFIGLGFAYSAFINIKNNGMGNLI